MVSDVVDDAILHPAAARMSRSLARPGVLLAVFVVAACRDGASRTSPVQAPTATGAATASTAATSSDPSPGALWRASDKLLVELLAATTDRVVLLRTGHSRKPDGKYDFTPVGHEALVIVPLDHSPVWEVALEGEVQDRSVDARDLVLSAFDPSFSEPEALWVFPLAAKSGEAARPIARFGSDEHPQEVASNADVACAFVSASPTETNRIDCVDKRDPAKPRTLMTELYAAAPGRGFAVDADAAYWFSAAEPSVWSVSLGGGSSLRLAGAEAEDGPIFSIQATAHGIFWSGAHEGSTVRYQDKAPGTALRKPHIVAPHALLDESGVWTYADGTVLQAVDGAPGTDGSLQKIATGIDSSNGAAANATTVFWLRHMPAGEWELAQTARIR